LTAVFVLFLPQIFIKCHHDKFVDILYLNDFFIMSSVVSLVMSVEVLFFLSSSKKKPSKFILIKTVFIPKTFAKD
jgi:hypothetical protein